MSHFKILNAEFEQGLSGYDFFVLSTYNYVGYHVNELMSAFDHGDIIQARTIQVLSTILMTVSAVLLALVVFTGVSSSYSHEQFKIQELLSYAKKLGEFLPNYHVFLTVLSSM